MNSDIIHTTKLYVSPEGNDNWSGALEAPNEQNNDGPLATLEGVIKRLRNTIRFGRDLPNDHVMGHVIVRLRGGRYHVDKPIVVGPDISVPVTFAAYPGEKPVIHGGLILTDWQETTINDQTAWECTIPEVAAGKWYFRQLFVNGERRNRPRFPKRDLFRMKEAPEMPVPAGWGTGGYTKFVCEDGDVKPFKNLQDIEVVYVHFWIEERSPIESFDPETNLITMSRPSRSALVGAHGSQLADYYLDNVLDALTDPGEWYLDREAGKVYYLPLPGETFENTEITAPKAIQLLRLCGKPDEERYVCNVSFNGITFQCTDWRHPGEDEQSSLDLLPNPSVDRFNRKGSAASGQAAADVPGVITMTGARNCAITNCEIRNIGWYGVYLANGCKDNRITGNMVRDLGAGGIKINGTAADECPYGRTSHNIISDNEITQAGRIFHSAVGVLIMNSAYNIISHNHIHDLFYSGISCGWIWGYRPSTCHSNLIEKNHIHKIGQGLLSDMGGVYLLGPQANTTVRNNLIHNVRKMHYGGWALYTDEGSSGIVLENNVCYDTNGNLFHQHYGRENIVRNNIFVNGDEEMIAYSRVEDHIGFTFMRNIVVSSNTPVFRANMHPEGAKIIADLNLYWDTENAEPIIKKVTVDEKAKNVTFSEWQEAGYDLNSIVADPKFANPAENDYSLNDDSPAFKLGFQKIDIADVGIRR